MIVAIIPARGGSKSIKNKNIVTLGGKPLIAWSIQTALGCNQINQVIVSTDSPKIAEISRRFGAITPFLRPKKLSTDTSPVINTFRHAVTWLEKKGKKIDKIVELQPTNPFRRLVDLAKAIKLLDKPQTDSVASVCFAEHNPYFVMAKIRNNYLKYPLMADKKIFYNRQQAPKVYRLTGSIIVVWRNVLMKKNSDITNKTRPIITLDPYNLDIDSQQDLFYAQFLLKNQKSS